MQRSKSVGAKTEVNENVLKICRANSLYSNRLFNRLEEATSFKRIDYKSNAAYVAAVVEKQLTDIRNEVESWLPKKHESRFQYKCRLEKLKLEKLEKCNFLYAYYYWDWVWPLTDILRTTENIIKHGKYDGWPR